MFTSFNITAGPYRPSSNYLLAKLRPYGPTAYSLRPYGPTAYSLRPYGPTAYSLRPYGPYGNLQLKLQAVGPKALRPVEL